VTVIGKLLITAYSIVVLLFIIIREFKKGDKGWKAALLIPIIILLINQK
jgi:ABC-type uncharacterized transport system permease subunit